MKHLSLACYTLGLGFSLAGIAFELADHVREKRRQTEVWTQADDEAAKEASDNASRD